MIAKYSYDSLNRITSVVTKDADGNLLTSYAYNLDATGRRTGLTELDGRTSQWAYDETYRLIQESIDDPVNGNYLATYQYDAVGNRLSRTADGVESTYVYDDNDRLLTTTEDGLETSYSYDAEGNLLEQSNSSDSKTYSYNAQNKLTGFTDGTNSISYQYNPEGIRIAKEVNGDEIRYVVDSNRDYAQVIAELDDADKLLKAYLYGSDLIAQESEGDWRFYHYDSLGTTRDLSDSAGQISDSYDYEAFGNILSRDGETDNAYLYTGEQYDPELDNYYLRARYYDQGVGRFTQMDSFEGFQKHPISNNKYIYAYQEPTNLFDYSGYSPVSLNDIGTALRINGQLATRSSGNIGSSMIRSLVSRGASVGGQRKNLGLMGNKIMEFAKEAFLEVLMDELLSRGTKAAIGTFTHTRFEKKILGMQNEFNKAFGKLGLSIDAEVFRIEEGGASRSARRRQKGSLGLDVVISFRDETVLAFDLKTGRGMSKSRRSKLKGRFNNADIFELFVTVK